MDLDWMFMKIVKFQKLVTKLVNVFIVFCPLPVNTRLAQTVQVAAGNTSDAQGKTTQSLFSSKPPTHKPKSKNLIF